jgi:RNA polymerase sigma-70 factor (sigma-E family)
VSRRDAEREAAFTHFMEQAGPSLLRTAWLLTGDAHDAQELTQAALVKTYVAWGRVRDGEGLAYARRVLVNHRTDRWRATRLERPTDTMPEPSPRPADPMRGSDDRDLVVRLLATLPEQQRRVVVLRYYTDLSEKATAEALGISVGAVKSAASRGLAALRAGLTDAPAEPEHGAEHRVDGSATERSAR